MLVHTSHLFAGSLFGKPWNFRMGGEGRGLPLFLRQKEQIRSENDLGSRILPEPCVLGEQGVEDGDDGAVKEPQGLVPTRVRPTERAGSQG